MSAHLVIVDDDRSMCEMLAEDLTRRGFAIDWFTDPDAALAYLDQGEVDVFLTDLNLPRTSGIELADRLGARRPDIPVVVITAFGSLDTAVAALRAGAFDFVTKPIDLDLLALVLSRAVHHRELHQKVAVLSHALEESGRFGDIIGRSEPMQTLYSLLSRVADSDASVLIVGESGTGKELVARSIHSRSRRKDHPFVAVNCSAMPDTLLESELFGYRRGAFTGATADRDGLFLHAAGGTLFLDEIGDLPLPLQPKLLRVLQERRIRPVGATDEVPVDVRIVAATNQDLESAVEQKCFREDLFYRLNVIQIPVPPLRTRGADILLLARHILGRIAAPGLKSVRGISDAAARTLLDYPWPGNVRELRNAIERAVALTPYDLITPADLPDRITAYRPTQIPVSDDPGALLPLEKIERRYVRYVLEAVGGNRSHAARILGLDRKTLYRKLREDDSDSSE